MDNNHTLVALLSMLIPMVAIIMGVSIGMLSLYLQFRRKREMFQLYHTERIAAIGLALLLSSVLEARDFKRLQSVQGSPPTGP
jgi:hypothetical protein